MAKLTSKGSGVGSDEEGSSSRFSGPHSITDSDTYTQVYFIANYINNHSLNA